MDGTFRAKLLGDTGFVKLDRVPTPHQHLSARLSTSRYYGANNVFFDPASPITNSAVSGNGEEDVATESAPLGLLSGLTPWLTSHLRVQFSRDLQQSFSNTTAGADEHLRLAPEFWAVVDIAAADAGTPAPYSRDFESEPRAKSVEVRRRRNVDLGLQLLSVAVRWGVFVREHSGESVYVCADARRAGADATHGVGAQRAAILHPEFWESGVASKQQRLLGIRAGHGSVDAAFHLEHGCTLRRADVFEDGDGK